MKDDLYYWLAIKTEKALIRKNCLELDKLEVLWDKYFRGCLFYDDLRT